MGGGLCCEKQSVVLGVVAAELVLLSLFSSARNTFLDTAGFEKRPVHIQMNEITNHLIQISRFTTTKPDVRLRLENRGHFGGLPCELFVSFLLAFLIRYVVIRKD